MKNRLYKKILCVLLSIALIVCSGAAFSMSIEAANYTEQLKAKGFPDSYVGYLVKLHDKYPNWDFEPFKQISIGPTLWQANESLIQNNLFKNSRAFQMPIIAHVLRVIKTANSLFRRVQAGIRHPKRRLNTIWTRAIG